MCRNKLFDDFERVMSKTVRLMPSEIEFIVNAGQTILEAALSNNINLEYSCSNGRCGQCKAELIDGSIDQSVKVVGVELLPNQILTCCATPEDNLILKAQYYPQLSEIERKTIPSKVDDIVFVNEDVMCVTLRLPATANFQFLPGQYIDLNWGGNKRSYSIASSCVHEHKLELHIKKVEGGLFSEFFFNELKKNKLFRFYGPLGTFFLRDSDGPLILLCTGSGFAPVKSMVESLIESGSTRSIYIYWGGRLLSDLYSDLPFAWSELYDNIQFIPVLSREENMQENFEAGYVQQAVMKQHENLKEFEVYACGSEQMIYSARQKMIENGLKTNNFYSDAFVPSN